MNAGWYDDPFRRFEQRYHDGNDWTEHVSDGSGASFVDPSGTSPYVQAEMPHAPPPPSGPVQGPRLASPLVRLGARLLDGLVVGMPVYLLVSALYEAPVEFSDDYTEYAIRTGPYLLLTALLAVYEVAMVGAIGRTLGKMALGISVVGADSGGVPGYGRAALRWAAFLFYNLPYGIGVLAAIATVVMSFVDPRRQTIHDKAAGTVVARAART